MAVRPFDPANVRVGWIGTGVMGKSMCGHLLQAGAAVTLTNRTPGKADDLLERGAVWADTPRAVAEKSDIVFAIVGYPSDVRSVFLDSDGALAGCGEGTVLVDMTTSEPTLAEEIAAEAKKKNCSALDAPVSGGDVGAKEARLSIMVGGEVETFEQVRPLFEVMGKTIVHQGPAGCGQHTKMVNQTLIATGMIGVCEALLYAPASGPGFGNRAQERLGRSGGFLVTIELRPADHDREL